jgi:hypothetical protein
MGSEQHSKENAIKQFLNILLVKFGLDSTSALNITNIIGVLFLESIDITYYTQYVNVVYLSVAISVYFIYRKWKNPFTKKLNYKSKTLVVKGLDPCNNILNYIKRNPSFYSKNFVAIIDENSESRSFLYPGSSIAFKDTIFGINGYIHGRKEIVQVSVLPQLSFPDRREPKEPLQEQKTSTETSFMEIELTSGNLSPIEYFDKIRDENKKMFSVVSSETTPIEIIQKNIITPTSSFPDSDMIKREFIDSFFSPEKDRLWSMVSTIHYNPGEFEKYGQSPCFNALLYGPPGSGKSSFAYRIARALGRNIDNVNLHKFVSSGSLSTLKKLLCYNQNIDKTVFIFDELDEAILYIRDQKLKKSDADKENAPPKLKMVNTEITMEDLLSIFQGAVPANKRIIFATTNNYEKLREISPALFRPGRLTPIHFDYLDWTRLNELSQFYFGKTLSFPPIEKSNIPTSEIIELAMTYVGQKDFDKFQKELHARLVK